MIKELRNLLKCMTSDIEIKMSIEDLRKMNDELVAEAERLGLEEQSQQESTTKVNEHLYRKAKISVIGEAYINFSIPNHE